MVLPLLRIAAFVLAGVISILLALFWVQRGPEQRNRRNRRNRRRGNRNRNAIRQHLGKIIFFCSCTIAFIAWFFMSSKDPEFRVDSFLLYNFTPTTEDSLSFSADVRITTRNPFFFSAISFGRIDAIVHYGSWPLARTLMPPFTVGGKSHFSLAPSFASAGFSVGHLAGDDGNNKETDRFEKVEFDLRLMTSMRTKGTDWRSLKVLCDNLVIWLPFNGRPGSLIGAPRWCKVE